MSQMDTRDIMAIDVDSGVCLGPERGDNNRSRLTYREQVRLEACLTSFKPSRHIQMREQVHGEFIDYLLLSL